MDTDKSDKLVQKYIDFFLHEVFDCKFDLILKALKSPLTFINDHFDSIKFKIDICVEENFYQDELRKDFLIEIEKKRSLMIDKIESFDRELLNRFKNDSLKLNNSTKLEEFSRKFQKDLTDLIKRTVLADNFDDIDFSNGLKLLKESLWYEIKEIKSEYFSNKWLFFKQNTSCQTNSPIFGRLILIDHIFDENIIEFITREDLKYTDFLKNINQMNSRQVLTKEHLKLLTLKGLFENMFTTDYQPVLEVNFGDYLSKMDELKLEFLNFYLIDSHTFNECSNLKLLNLSHNRISNISNNILWGLKSIKILDLSGNHLTTIESNCFKGLLSLEELNLSNNKINVLENDAFKGLKNLKQLVLSNNFIKSIQSNLFIDLINLKRLMISRNNLERINKNTFKNLKNLEELYLYSNSIEIIDCGAFDDLINLKFLAFSKNKLKTIHKDLFKSLINLNIFNLSFNQIDNIESDAFINLNSLKILDLSQNRINFLNLEIFNSLKCLTDLDLTGNCIGNLSFESLKSNSFWVTMGAN